MQMEECIQLKISNQPFEIWALIQLCETKSEYQSPFYKEMKELGITKKKMIKIIEYKNH